MPKEENMKRTGLIRLAGLAAMTGGGVYAASGLITLPIVPSLFGGNIIAENLPFALLLVGAAASIVALHVLHKDLPRDRYGPLGLLASVMAVAGAGLLLVGGSAIFLGLLLVTGGLVALAVVTMGAGVLPRWCGVALIVGNPVLVLLGEAWMATLVGAAWAVVGHAVFRAGARSTAQASRVR
jgi:hypothetical protein